MASSNESATNVEAHRRAVPAHVPAFVVSLLVTTAGCARGVWPEEGGESDGPFTLGDGSDGELGGGDAPGDDSFNEDCELGGEGCPCIVSDDCAPDLECEDEVCILPGVCGDGVHNGGEECDDGEANADDMACKSDCTLQWCGDGLLGPQEQCDDGNVDGADGCSQCDCRLTFTDAADTGDWTLTGDWAIRSEAPYANGQLPAVPFVSQGLVLGTDGNRSSPYPGEEEEASSATTSELTIPPVLRFRSWHVDEGGTESHDVKRIVLSVDDEQSWMVLMDCDVGPNDHLPMCQLQQEARAESDWDEIELVLAQIDGLPKDIVGQPGKLRFEYATEEGESNMTCCGFEQGWFIDDLNGFDCS